MSLHIEKFIDLVKAQESRGSQQLIMSMKDAKDLHADITKILLVLHEAREQLIQQQKDQVITVEVDGRPF